MSGEPDTAFTKASHVALCLTPTHEIQFDPVSREFRTLEPHAKFTRVDVPFGSTRESGDDL